jgi:hypothetical protein
MNPWKPFLVYFSICTFYVLIAMPLCLLGYTTDQSASTVVGQTSFASNSANNGGINANALNSAAGVFTDGTRLFVADTSNNRVLIFNTMPTGSYASADVVVGQPDFVSNQCNQGGAGPTANALCGPSAVYSDGTRLFVADSGNNRVLIYSSIPTSNDASASVVIGQSNMTSALPVPPVSGSYTPTANSLFDPLALASDGTRLYVADAGNYRVLIYNSIPSSNNAAANVEIGQVDMSSRNSNVSNVTASTLNTPTGIALLGGKLVVADYNFARVLIYNYIPTVSAPAADLVLGQPNMTTAAAPPTSASTLIPWGLATDGTRLFIADQSDSRVLIYDQLPGTNYAAADKVLGQANFSANLPNQGGGASAAALQYPEGIALAGIKLAVADTANNRILLYDDPPTPTPTVTPTATATRTSIISPTFTSSFTATPTVTRTASPTFSWSPTRTASPTTTATPSDTRSSTPSLTPTPTFTPSKTGTTTFTGTSTQSPTGTDTQSFTPTMSPTSTPTASPSATQTESPSATPSLSPTTTWTATGTATLTDTSTMTPSTTLTPSATQTPSPTATESGTSTSSQTPSDTDTVTPSAVASETQNASMTNSLTATFTTSHTPTETETVTATSTATDSPEPSVTSSPSTTASPSSTQTASATTTPPGTLPPIQTATVTASVTEIPSASLTPPIPSLTVTKTASTSTSNQAGPGEAWVYPSPARGPMATFVCFMQAPGRIHLQVVNRAGVEAAMLDDSRPSGPATIPLSLTDFQSGVYYALLDLHYDGGREEKLPLLKFVVLR